MNMRKPSGNHSSEKTKAETQKKEDGQREAKPKIKLSELILHLDTLQKKIYSKTRDSAEAGKPKLNSLINNWSVIVQMLGHLQRFLGKTSRSGYLHPIATTIFVLSLP